MDGLREQNDRNANPTAKEGQKVFHGTLAQATRRDREEAPSLPRLRRPSRSRRVICPESGLTRPCWASQCLSEECYPPTASFNRSFRVCIRHLLCVRLGVFHLLSLVLPQLRKVGMVVSILEMGKLRQKAVLRTLQDRSAGRDFSLPSKPILFSIMTPGALVFFHL